jgi:putative membrane protein
MLVGRKIPLRFIWLFGWRNLLVTFLLAGAVCGGYHLLGWKHLAIPFLPVATIGTAVAFYIGFKNNSAYSRLWEARQIWGQITNSSRAWGYSTSALIGHRQLEEFAPEARETVRILAYRHLAWINVLRLQLRRPSALNASHDALPQMKATAPLRQREPAFPGAVAAVLSAYVAAEERGSLASANNPALQLLHRQALALAALKRRQWIDDFEHSDLMRLLNECANAQGAAERIKSFPLPRQYANFSLVFVRIFIFLLPFGLVGEMPVLPGGPRLVIPFTLLISWVFYSMEQVGDASENPFEGALNDVPLSVMCRKIEIDLRALIGEQELPARLEPVDSVLL